MHKRVHFRICCLVLYLTIGRAGESAKKEKKKMPPQQPVLWKLRRSRSPESDILLKIFAAAGPEGLTFVELQRRALEQYRISHGISGAAWCYLEDNGMIFAKGVHWHLTE